MNNEVEDADHVQRAVRKRNERIAEFAQFGVQGEPKGGMLGAIRFSASEAEKLLKLLRQAKRLQRKRVP